jgi:chromate transporter
VVGVILSLALFFAQHVFFPDASSSMLDATAVGLAILSLWLLVKKNLSIIKLVGLCAVFGLVRYYLLLV